MEDYGYIEKKAKERGCRTSYFSKLEVKYYFLKLIKSTAASYVILCCDRAIIGSFFALCLVYLYHKKLVKNSLRLPHNSMFKC